MTASATAVRWRRRTAVVALLCLVVGIVAAFVALRPTSAQWADPVHARGDVVIGSWAMPVNMISAGDDYTCLNAAPSGTVWCTGEGSSGAPKTGRTSNVSTMSAVPAGAIGTQQVTWLGTGEDHTCAVALGAAYCWGTSGGALGNYSPANPTASAASASPVAVYAGDSTGAPDGYRSPLFGETVTRVEPGDRASCALLATGRVACWGSNTGLTRPASVPSFPSAPYLVPTAAENASSQLPAGTVITNLVSESLDTCVWAETGPLYCWGQNGDSQLGVSGAVPLPRALPRGPSGTGPITSVDSGTSHLCFISAARAYCSGSDSDGSLGNGGLIGGVDESTPVAVSTSGALSGVDLVKVTAGTSFSCALSTAGRAYCWGTDLQGQLGTIAILSSTSPIAVDMSLLPAGVTFTDIDSGYSHTCARGTNDSIYCWGSAISGEQGTGSGGIIDLVSRPQTPMVRTWP